MIALCPQCQSELRPVPEPTDAAKALAWRLSSLTFSPEPVCSGWGDGTHKRALEALRQAETGAKDERRRLALAYAEKHRKARDEHLWENAMELSKTI